ncbi:DUF1351 domain-containing protein [Ligilactobacillus ruminis]|uniref:DUF1351 domain-containing protein n=1 Tax=Ligilactobacillus ruminis TaxID=1623 RepID=UPI0022E263CA|nr:DUF1351 domain-containing protein [Ligilactobacillus ruminis]
MEPLKKIEVNFTPGTIEFPSADRLKLYVNEMLEKTKGLVATDDSIKATKASRTEVNKLEKSIADVRKKYKKAWNEPFSAFESSLKELEGDCKAASQELKETIDSFEDQQKQERRKSVQELITEMAPNYHVSPEDVEILDKWLLKSTSKKAVLEGVAESMKTLQRLNAEKAQVEKLCLKHELPAERYIDLLQRGMTYIEVEQVIETDLRKQEEVADLFKQQRAAEVVAQKASMVDVGDGKLIDTETGEIKHELQRVSLELQGTKEQIDDIARYIVKSGVKIVSSSERETVFE